MLKKTSKLKKLNFKNSYCFSGATRHLWQRRSQTFSPTRSAATECRYAGK